MTYGEQDEGLSRPSKKTSETTDMYGEYGHDFNFSLTLNKGMQDMARSLSGSILAANSLLRSYTLPAVCNTDAAARAPT